MFYNIFLFLTIVYTANDPGNNDDIVNEEDELSNIYPHDIDHLCMHAQKIVDEKNIHAKIYQNIMEAFVEKYMRCNKIYDEKMLNDKDHLPIDYKPDDIEKLCSEVEKKYNFTSNDRYFNIYKKLFIESAIFSLNTIKTVYDVDQKPNNDRERLKIVLYTDPILYKNCILSMNWLNSILYMNNVVFLLNIYDEHKIIEYELTYHQLLKYRGCVNFCKLKFIKKTINLAKLLKEFYEKNKNIANIKLEHTHIENIMEWMKIMDHIYRKNWRSQFKKYKRHLLLSKISIIYLSNYIYAAKDCAMTQKYDIPDLEMQFFEIQWVGEFVKNIYKTKFNILHIHSKETIAEIFALTQTFEEKIRQLIIFTEHINQFFFYQIKEIFRKEIQKYLNERNIIKRKITKRKVKTRCMLEIDKIKYVIRYKTQNSMTDMREILEKNYFDVFNDALCNNNYICNFNWLNYNKIKYKARDVYYGTDCSKEYSPYNTLYKLLIQIINMTQEIDKQKEKIEYKCSCIERANLINKLIYADTKAGTLFNLAQKESIIYLNGERDTVIKFLDEILLIQRMIYIAQRSVSEILKEIKKKQSKPLEKKKPTLKCVNL